MQYATSTPADLPKTTSRWSSTEPAPRPAETPSEVRSKTEPEAEIRRLRAALEDILALAQGSGELQQRSVQIRRRAMAALSRTDT